MADSHGGYRAPANPAPVSGPGSLSQRTDGKQPIMDLPDAKYGENAQFRADQAGAPVPQAASPATAPVPPGPPDLGPVPAPLSGGTLIPGQPVTHGADSGPGADSSALGLGSPDAAQHQSALSMVQSLAASPNASPAIRALASSLSGGF
jgi:hypothetical protein